MKNNILAVIGIGSCGNQQAKIAGMEQISSLAINTALVDLNDIVIDEKLSEYVTALKIGTSEGCGKDRNLSKQMVKEDMADILTNVQELGLTGVQNILVCYSVNNGTGSGAGPVITDILRSMIKGINVIGMPVLPVDTTTRSLANSLSCMNEVIQMNAPYIAIDNSTCKSTSIKEVYDRVNEDMLLNMKILNGDYLQPSSYANMDEQDRKRLFSTPGMMRICKVSGIKNSNDSTMSKLILDSIKNNFGAPMQGDKIVKRMGVIYTLTEEMLKKIDHSYTEIYDVIGKPIEVFEHINIVEDEKQCSIITILSGLSAPDDRLEEMKEMLDEAKNVTIKVKKSRISELAQSTSWLDDINEFDDLDVKEVDSENLDDTSQLDDILSKYM